MFRFRLVEDIDLNESKTGLNKSLLVSLRKSIADFMSDNNTELHAERGQTSLLEYLKKNNNLTDNDICVHHIYFNHNDYDAGSVCLLTNKAHLYVHKGLMYDVIREYFRGFVDDKSNTKYKHYKDLHDIVKDDLTEQEIDGLVWAYAKAYFDFIDENRRDKKFPQERD